MIEGGGVNQVGSDSTVRPRATDFIFPADTEEAGEYYWEMLDGDPATPGRKFDCFQR
jgi:hypothetical protein